MDIYLGRQPLFDKNQSIYGYELLFPERNMTFQETEGQSSYDMLNSFLIVGIDKLTSGKKVLINFSDNLLRQGVATLFPKDRLIIGIPEKIGADAELLKICEELHKSGYSLAFDAPSCLDGGIPFEEYAEWIRVDFGASAPEYQRKLFDRLKIKKVKFIAKKIETYDELQNAKAWGYSLFQGYFFSKPIIFSVKDIQPMKFNYLRLIQSVLDEDNFDFDKIADIIKMDVSLTYKLLRLVNSAAFGFRTQITALRQALVILGIDEIKKWVSLIAIKGIGEGQPNEMVRLSLIRAKCFELLADSLMLKNKSDQLFLLGLFSSLDVLMNRPIDEVLTNISVSDEVKKALIYKEGIFGWVYQLMLAYEYADWEKVSFIADILHINQATLISAYIDAVQWSHQLENEAKEK